MKVEKIDHVHIYVRDIEKSIQRLEYLLGVKFGEVMKEELEAFGAVGAFAPPGLDISQPTSPDSPTAKIIERMGEGLVGGASFKVQDIEAGIAELESKGMKLLGSLEIGGLKEAWFHPKDSCGLMIELCEYDAENALAAVRQRK
ncbi:MAG: VOC family protein [Chloroflexi bacterium]|nr:VOC family protein [Chloroflexota bacterium]